MLPVPDTETIKPLQSLHARYEAKCQSRLLREKIVKYARNHRSPLDPLVQLLPDPIVEELVKIETVRMELSRSKKPELRVLGLQNYRKGLAVLYLMKLPTKIRLLVEHEVQDRDLPLELVAGIEGGKSCLFLKSRVSPKAAKFRFKKDVDNQEFERLQWSVLVFAFPGQQTRGVPHYEILHQEILPFRRQKSVDRRGAYGQVYETEVYSEHHDWPGNPRIVSLSHAVLCMCTKSSRMIEMRLRAMSLLSKHSSQEMKRPSVLR